MSQRLLPLVALSFFLGVGIVWRCALQFARHNSFGVALFKESPVRGVLAALALVVALAQAAVAALRPELLSGWLLFDAPRVNVLGLAICVQATCVMAFAQLDLGASWRIGIEPNARPGLVTGGFYRVSRNPIFSFMLVAIVGAFLTLPTLLSLAMLAVSFVVVRVQVAREERWLRETYGEEYEAYRMRTRRFLLLK